MPASTTMATGVICVFVLVLVGGAYSQYLDANNCVKDKATFNQTSGLCECNAGLVGAGDLCCNVPDNKDVCFMSGDPVLTSVKGQRVPINIPCSICIAVVESTANNGQKCVFEVLATSVVEDNGAMYNSIIRVGVSVNNALAKFFSMTGDKVDVGDPRAPTQTLTAADLGSAGETVVVGGENIVVKYDATAKIWSVEGCESSVSFRPYTSGSKLNSGTCIQAKKSSIVKTVENGNICGLPPTYDASIPWAYGVLGDALSTRQVFDPQQRVSHPDYSDVCRDDIDDMMNGACQGIAKDAAAQCGPILYNAAVRVCLARVGVKGNDVLKLFGFCLDTFCNGLKDTCDEFGEDTGIVSCLPSFAKCDQWPYFVVEEDEEEEIEETEDVIFKK